MASYSEQRELNHIKARIKSDKEFNLLIEKEYNKVLVELRNELNQTVSNFATNEGISIVEAKKKIDKMDIESFNKKVEEYVFNKDFSLKANEELRLYNVTMQTNRLELLEKRIEINLINLANKEVELLERRINLEIEAELERQAGILGFGVKTKKELIEAVKTYLDSNFHSTEYSSRIWINSKELTNLIERGIERSLLRGQHPRAWIKTLMPLMAKGVESARYKAERLAVTEVGRVQIEATKAALERMSYEKYIFIAEPDCCNACAPHNGETYNLKDLVQGENAPMMHPWCRCSIAATEEE